MEDKDVLSGEGSHLDSSQRSSTNFSAGPSLFLSPEKHLIVSFSDESGRRVSKHFKRSPPMSAALPSLIQVMSCVGPPLNCFKKILMFMLRFGSNNAIYMEKNFEKVNENTTGLDEYKGLLYASKCWFFVFCKVN